MQTEMHIQPTLILLLGTSPARVGLRIRRLMESVYGPLPIIRYLWIDVNNTVEDPEAAAWFSPMERAELAGFNSDEVLASIEAYPTIKAWWPSDCGLLPGFVRDGANQIRLIGRMALHRMFSDRNAGPAFIDKLSQATDALLQIENIDQTERMSTPKRRFIVDRGNVRVYIIFSTCGGSGSSLTWDVAYLTRHLLRGSNPTMIGIGTLPPVIDTAIKNETRTQKEKIRANTYAWFKEDAFLREHPHWNTRYPEGAPIDMHAPPFDLQFTLDLGNQAGYRLNSAEDIYTMLAQAVFLDTGSSIGGAIRGFNTNVSVLRESFRGRRRAYSSLAAASLIYPAQKIGGYCASELGKAMVEDGLLAPPDGAEVAEAASALLGRLRLRDAPLLEILLADRQVPNLNATAIRKSSSPETIRSLLAAQEKQDVQRRQQQSERIVETAQELLAAGQKIFEREIAGLAVQRGVPFARAVLALLADEVDSDEPVTESTQALAGFRVRVLQQGIGEGDLVQAEQAYRGARAELQSLEGGIWKSLRKQARPNAWKQDLERLPLLEGGDQRAYAATGGPAGSAGSLRSVR